MARGQHQHLLAIMVAGIAPKGHETTPDDAVALVNTATLYLNVITEYVDYQIPMPEEAEVEDGTADAS